MDDLQNLFARAAAADLDSIKEKLSENPNENSFAELARRLHTIKGTAQTFNLTKAAELAHSLENILDFQRRKENADRENGLDVLTGGIEFLTATLHDKNFVVPAAFADRLQKFRSAPHFQFENRQLPPLIFDRLSTNEKSILNAALDHGKDLTILEIGFETATFAEDYKRFRERLGGTGEIVAALPNPDFKTAGRLNFQIIFVAESAAAVDESGAKVVFRIRQNFSNDVPGVLARIVAHGETLAKKLGKECEINVAAAERIELSAETLKVIFDALLHLVRNALDHGIERRGKIEIKVAQSANAVTIEFADDGKGVDTEKLRSLAAGENLSEREVTDLIFAPGMTTAAGVSEISGRGIGLDAVKTSVENVGGTISVTSGKARGTKFIVRLPREK